MASTLVDLESILISPISVSMTGFEAIVRDCYCFVDSEYGAVRNAMHKESLTDCLSKLGTAGIRFQGVANLIHTNLCHKCSSERGCCPLKRAQYVI